MSWPRRVLASLMGALTAACVACAALPPAGPGSVKRPNYVALGDSVAAAPGVPEPAEPEACHKSTNNYPAVLARRLDATSLRDVTCSGATTDDIISRQQQTDGVLMARQIDAVGASTELVTITVGANDVGLAGDAESCVVRSPNPNPCTRKFVVGDVDRVSGLITAQIPVWATMIDEIRSRAPRARIIWVGYGIFVRSGGCFPSQPVLPLDSDYLQAKLNELDDRQRQLAAEKKVDFFDTRGLSEGHDMCAPPAEQYIEGYVTHDDGVPLHPTALGATAVGNALTDYIVLSAHR